MSRLVKEGVALLQDILWDHSGEGVRVKSGKTKLLTISVEKEASTAHDSQAHVKYVARGNTAAILDRDAIGAYNQTRSRTRRT